MINDTLPDIRAAWEHAYFGLLDDRPGVVDYYQRNIVHSFNNTLRAEKAVFDFDLGDLGLTPTKWSKFTGQYVDVETLHAWVNTAPDIRTYDSLWTFRIVPPNFGGKKAVHRWGNCLLGFSFRRRPKPTLSLYTRTQSLGFSGVADYALCDFVARRFAERLGISPESISLNIFCGNFIIKMVEVVHYLSYTGKLEEYLERDNRISESIKYYWDYMHKDPDNIKWRAARRMKQKLDRVHNNVHRSFPVEDLTIKGWHAYTRVNRKLTQREASKLILTGEGKRGLDVMTLVDDPIEDAAHEELLT
jgi:hypothetical protein